jgi:hypothetical protein
MMIVQRDATVRHSPAEAAHSRKVTPPAGSACRRGPLLHCHSHCAAAAAEFLLYRDAPPGEHKV